MSTELKPGVYRHYKDGRFYLLEFVADFWGLEAVEQDQRLAVVIDYDACMGDAAGGGVPSLRIEDAVDDPTVCTIPLFYARAHGRIEPKTACAVYVPLYADKPGLRRSVRPVSEWTERVEVASEITLSDPDGTVRERGVGYTRVERFTYIGEVIS